MQKQHLTAPHFESGLLILYLLSPPTWSSPGLVFTMLPTEKTGY